MKNVYYNSSSAYVYPSANAQDGGEINSEENLRLITKKFSPTNFAVLGASDPLPLKLEKGSEGQLIVYKGACSIDGYYISVGQTEMSFTGFNSLAPGRYNVIISVIKDATGHVRGDGVELRPEYRNVCYGVVLTFISDSELGSYTIPYLMLGTIEIDSSGSLSTVEENPERFSYILARLIRTSTGEGLETWVQKEINTTLDEKLSVLDKLQTGTGGVLDLDDNALNLTVIIDGKQKKYNLVTEIEKVSSGQFALKDHNHDTRYLMLDKGSPQTVSGPVRFSNNLAFTSLSNETRTFSVDNNGQLLVGSSDPYLKIETNGNLTTQGTITASKVYGAVWNDYADALPKDEEIEPGDIVAKSTSSEGYVKAACMTKMVVGVCSDTYGHLLGGQGSIDTTLETHAPVAVAGNVRVKVKGTVSAGELIVASDTPGVGRACSTYIPGTVVGKSLEDKTDEGVSRILIQVMLI